MRPQRKLDDMAEKVSPLELERYELKFLIHQDLVEPISQYIENLGCFLDAYADETQTYLINSLYLDSPNSLFARKKINGDEPRFNLRIRSYGSRPVAPYFIEVKYKECGIVRKYRHPLSEEIWTNYFSGDFAVPFSSEIEDDAPNYRTIERLARTYNVEPKILTQYRRKAYLSAIDDYARVTFDSDLRFQKVDSYILEPNDEAMIHYDNPLHFSEGANVILELKCTTKVPLWIMDVIKYFNLDRGNFSKYTSSSSELQSLESVPRLNRQEIY